MRSGAVQGVKSDKCDVLFKGSFDALTLPIDLPLLATVHCDTGCLEYAKPQVDSVGWWRE